NSIRDLHSVNSEEISSPQSLEKTRSLIDEHLNLAVEKYQNVLPRAIHSFSNKDFLTFWLFSPVLLVSNQEIYSQVLKNLDAEKAQLESKSKSNTSQINGLKNTQALVQEERAIHAAIILHTNHYIVKQNRKIVESEPEAPNDINTFFLLNCLLPRMKVSAVDELMCEKYVEKFVIKKQPRSFLNFLVILDRFIDHLHAQICSSTERECTFIGRFLNFCLRYVNMWHSDAKKYEEAAGNNASIQCLILPQIRSVDFLVAPLNHDQLTNNDEKIVHESLTMTHQMFKEYTQAIHKKLTIIIIAILQHSHSAGALSSPPTPNASNSHAIILRNLVTVLQNAVEQFPMWQKHAHHVQIEVLEINKNFSVPKRGRKDIATLTSSYLVNLGNTSSRWFKKEAGKAVPERRNPSSSSPSSSSADQKNPKKALEAQSSSTNSHNSLKHQTEI
ncbi:MAG: THO complex subunit 2, partial [Marteilia pararefringens]